MEPLDEVDPLELVQFHFATVQALVPHKDIDVSRSRVSNFDYQKTIGANMKALNVSVRSSKFQLERPSATSWEGDEVQPTAEKGSLIQKGKLS